jgi:hypothetical protein
MRIEAHERKARHEFGLEVGGVKAVAPAIRFGDAVPADRFHKTNQIGPDGIETCGPHSEEPCEARRPEVLEGRRMDASTIAPVAALRDARKSALLRTRLSDDIDMIRTCETNDWPSSAKYRS